MSANGDRPLPGVPSRKALPEGPGADAPAGPAEADAPEMLPSVFGPGEKLRPYAEVLRDRLVTYFDLNNLFHKPKLVAITGCHRGAGATTVATALAASLSETGDGNVLLVDMRPDSGVAQQFLQGKPQFGLLDALDLEKRGGTQIQDKLYLVAEHEMTGGLSKMLPKRFAQLLPRLRLSDYDYIIFDLPEMSRTSTAPRVGRFMDLVLLVAEAERTNIDLLRQSAKVLAESGATVGAVLNRTRQYVPARLSHELT
jgi:Mrp family chromosome partitioning ATPase